MAPAALRTSTNGATNGASSIDDHPQEIQCDAPPPVKVTTVDQLHSLQKKTKPATPRTPSTPEGDKTDSALKSIRYELKLVS
jgi:hypothetical protein